MASSDLAAVQGAEQLRRMARLEAMMEAAGTGWYERDMATGHMIGSGSCRRIFGLSDSRTGWSRDEFLACIVPEDRAPYYATIEPALADGEVRTLRYRIARPDGQLRHLEVRYVETARDGSRYRTGLVSDITDRIRTEERLRSDEELLQHAITAVKMVPWERDLSQREFQFHPSGAAFYGLPEGSFKYRFDEFFARVHPDDQEMVRSALASALANAGSYSASFRLLNPNGSYRWIETKGEIIADAEGRPDRIVGVSWDVTERRHSQDRLASIARQVPGMVYQLKRSADGAYSIPYVSEGIHELFRCKPQDVYADAATLFRNIPMDDAERIRVSIEASAASLAPWRQEFRVMNADGSVRWLTGCANPQRERDGSVLWHGHTADITERKTVELELEDTKSRLSLAVAAADMIVWRWDLATDRVSSPQSFAHFHDGPSDRLRMHDLLAAIQPDDAGRVKSTIEAAMRAPSNETLTIEYCTQRANGVLQFVETRARAEFDGDGRHCGFLGVSIDITKRVVAERDRNSLINQLEQAQKLEMIGLMTGGIAHDFNNILSGILGYAELASRYGDHPSGAGMPRYLDEIRNAGERGAALIRHMLAFCRGESTATAHQALAPLVERAIQVIRPMFPATVDLRTSLPADLPEVVIDPVQIQQIVMNLCINARDAMTAAGTIDVALRRVGVEQRLCAACHAPFDGDYVVMSVLDSGSGISADVLPRIFEPLYSTKNIDHGTGLGLSIVSGIVHRHHGHIGVETALGSGSCFEVYLPLPAADTRVADSTTAADHL